MCVLAGAGTGKTRDITHRIGYSVHSGAYQPQRVPAITFTARAAGVMIEANTGRTLREALARALYPVVRELVRPKAGAKLKKARATFKAFSVKVDVSGAWSFGLDVAPGQGRGDSGNSKPTCPS